MTTAIKIVKTAEKPAEDKGPTAKQKWRKWLAMEPAETIEDLESNLEACGLEVDIAALADGRLRALKKHLLRGPKKPWKQNPWTGKKQPK